MSAPPAACPGCGGLFAPGDGATHPYMLSSPGCWERYGIILAREYADPTLMPTHRLTVDAYAVQHPGSADDRRAVQSVGLHLARLSVQVEGRMAPAETHATMVRFGRAKASLPYLKPPRAFAITVADLPTDATPANHIAAVTAWAAAAWADWSAHHAFIRRWVATI